MPRRTFVLFVLLLVTVVTVLRRERLSRLPSAVARAAASEADAAASPLAGIPSLFARSEAPTATVSAQSASGPSGPPSAQLLFIGNSYTAVNDLPGTLQRLARSMGKELLVEAIAPGGQTLEGHEKDPNVAALLAARPWSWVVLQEQSQRPAFGPALVEASTIAPAIRLADRIRRARPSARIALYETWGRRNGDLDNCASYAPVCSFEGMQQRLHESYATMADRTAGRLVPVGAAWSRVRAEHPEIELYAGDGSHPSPAGTYLAACVFYVALFREQLRGASDLGLDPAVARALQRTAETVALTGP